MTKSIADRMAEAAEMDLALPYSLMLDAWDLLDGAAHGVLREAFAYDPHTGFSAALIAALDEYDADQLGYWTPERIARARGDN